MRMNWLGATLLALVVCLAAASAMDADPTKARHPIKTEREERSVAPDSFKWGPS